MGAQAIEVARKPVGEGGTEKRKAEVDEDGAAVLPLPDHKKQRKEWAARLRQLLSPPGMLNEDGTIDQSFFKPKKVVIHVDRRWGDAEKDKLVEGIRSHGVGGWRTMKEKLLPKWDENTLRVKACRLIGCQNLKRYAGWKPTKSEMEAEFARNMELGKRLGCWKAGMLVDNDNGDVAKALAEAEGAKS